MDPGQLRLIVGLGNPGSKYVGSRHNIGFMALDHFASRNRAGFRLQSKLQGYLADVNFGARKLKLLMPDTFMNESGRSIRAVLDWFGLTPCQLLILVDDMDLPLGRLRLRARGGAGGHNGMRSAIQYLGGHDFARLRIGIGAPGRNPSERRALTVSHVLGTFQATEHQLVDAVLGVVADGIILIQEQGLERAGNSLNTYGARAYKVDKYKTN